MTVANIGITTMNTTNTPNKPNKPQAHFFHQTEGSAHSKRSKICSKYNEIRPITSFNKSAKKADGLHTQCRACRSTYQSAPVVWTVFGLISIFFDWRGITRV